MPKKRVFISFDFDYDLNLKNLLAGQDRNPDSPFEISDWSLKEAAPERDWELQAYAKIIRSNIVVVVLGNHTSRASGVRKEVRMARNANIPVVQIKIQGTNPIHVDDAGVVYDWTWENLKRVLS